MATQTLTQRQPDASAATSVRIEALAGGKAKSPVILALDLGQKTGWAVRPADGRITSGTSEYRQDRWQGGGIRFLLFKRWLTELKNCVGEVDLIVFEQVRRHASVDSSHALRWATLRENAADTFLHGTHNRGSRNGQAKIDEVCASAIRKMHSMQIPRRVAAEGFGLRRQAIDDIVNGKRWRHVR